MCLCIKNIKIRDIFTGADDGDMSLLWLKLFLPEVNNQVVITVPKIWRIKVSRENINIKTELGVLTSFNKSLFISKCYFF